MVGESQSGGGNSDEESNINPLSFFFLPHYRMFQIERVEISIRETIHRETVSL